MSSQDQTPDLDISENTAPIAEPSVMAAEENRPSFAERVGKKRWTPAPDPFSIATDYQIGVRLFESKRDHQMAFMFGEGRPEDKPSLAVLQRMYKEGCRWNEGDRIWAMKFTAATEQAVRLKAKRLHTAICNMIREERGMEPLPEMYR